MAPSFLLRAERSRFLRQLPRPSSTARARRCTPLVTARSPFWALLVDLLYFFFFFFFARGSVSSDGADAPVGCAVGWAAAGWAVVRSVMCRSPLIRMVP